MTDAQARAQFPREPAFVTLLILACSGIAYSCRLLLGYVHFAAKATGTQGVVVARDSIRFTIEFQVDGQTFRMEEDLPSIKGSSALERVRLRPGAEVTVLYDPASPQNAKWKSNRLWIFPVAILALSSLGAMVALFARLNRLTKRPKIFPRASAIVE